MYNKSKFILNLLPELITPALGCTEIGCIAYATSIVGEKLKNKLKSVTVHISGFIYRNVVNVAVPLLGKIGAKGIAAAGLLMKQSNKKLLVLDGITPQQIKQTKQLMTKNIIKIEVEKNCDPVYVKVVAKDVAGNVCSVLIERKHDVVRYVKLNNVILTTNSCRKNNAKHLLQIKYDVNDISLADLYKTTKLLTLADLKFLQDGIKMNHKIALAGSHKQYFSHTKPLADWHESILASTFNAVAARMDGCPLPVMSSNNSGDHGLTISVPQYTYHQKAHTSELLMLQSVALAHLITWKIKRNIGELSAYCGSVVAATTGTIVGLGWQRNYNLKQLNDLINYCLSSFCGILCDGAKLSCAWKIETALINGFRAMELVECKQKLSPNEGINNANAFETIKLLGKLSKGIMNATNLELVDIINCNALANPN